MFPTRWGEVKEKLQVAFEMEPLRRAAYLEELEASDPELRREIESLLDSHEQAGADFLNTSARDLFAEPDLTLPHSAMIGRRIGSYQIVEQIGAGGMGEVYRAVRADEQYRKEVALKLVSAGPDAAFVIGRFKNERQILAGLDHPNIARLLDGGVTEDGVPYFIMELIEGRPVDEFCDHHRLPVTERLILFRQICSAVQYAHQHLIVHRDIKPGNILVSADGVPKLLDFGIAKILSADGTSGRPEQTLSVFGALTPGYASPEQIKGEPITTASDVYSLGVVLYELLTGHRPYRLASRSSHEIARAVCEMEPEKPSTAVTRTEDAAGISASGAITPEAVSAARDGSPDKLRRRLNGDLDNIVLKAMRKEPQRRYASVEQFSEDIRRHLEHLPVTARKDTLAYLTTKFVARHRTGVAATILLILALIGGFAATLREARIARAERARAERRFNDVRNLSSTLLFQIDDSIKSVPGTTNAQQLVIGSAQQYLDSLSQEASGDVSLLRQLATGYGRLGRIQGSTRDANLGNSKAAIGSLRKEVALREAITKATPSDSQAQLELQIAYEALGHQLLDTDLNEAAVYFSKSMNLASILHLQNPSSPQFLHALTQDTEDQATVLSMRNDMEGARKIQAEALRLAKELVAMAPDEPNRALISYQHKRLGALLIEEKEYAPALTEYQEAQRLDEALLAQHPVDANRRYAITYTYSDIGFIYWKQTNYQKALENYRKVLGIREALASADPHDARALAGVAKTCGYIGDILRDQEKPKEALAYNLRELAILVRLSGADPRRSDLRVDLAELKGDVGDDYMEMAEAMKSGAERQRLLHLAQPFLEQALAGMTEAKAHGMLFGEETSAPDQIARDLARCRKLANVHSAP